MELDCRLCSCFVRYELFEARELSWSGLLKSDWNPDEHPHWPSGSPDSQGGQFAPKGEGQTDGSGVGNNLSDDDVRYSTGTRATSIGTAGEEHSDPWLVPAVEHDEDKGLFDPVVYRGVFHDETVNELAQRLRIKGCTVETEVILQMADGSASTRIDLLVKGSNTPVVGVEVKTGEEPSMTKAQLYVYPHLIMGGSVIAPYGARGMGLPSMVPLPPIPVFLFYKKNWSTDQVVDPLSKAKMLDEFVRRYGRMGKFAPDPASKEETPRMSESEFPDGMEEFVMLLHEVGGLELASREIALAMAEMTVRKVYGEEHLKTQLPLQITDKGDRWLIEGSRRGEDYPVRPLGIHQDKVIIEIRKRDCQVLNFAQMAF